MNEKVFKEILKESDLVPADNLGLNDGSVEFLPGSLNSPLMKVGIGGLNQQANSIINKKIANTPSAEKRADMRNKSFLAGERWLNKDNQKYLNKVKRAVNSSKGNQQNKITADFSPEQGKTDVYTDPYTHELLTQNGQNLMTDFDQKIYIAKGDEDKDQGNGYYVGLEENIFIRNKKLFNEVYHA